MGEALKVFNRYGREEFCGVSRSAERRVQDVHERWRDKLTTQKNRA